MVRHYRPSFLALHSKPRKWHFHVETVANYARSTGLQDGGACQTAFHIQVHHYLGTNSEHALETRAMSTISVNSAEPVSPQSSDRIACFMPQKYRPPMLLEEVLKRAYQVLMLESEVPTYKLLSRRHVQPRARKSARLARTNLLSQWCPNGSARKAC